MTVEIRPVRPGDETALWALLEPIIREGETYALPRDMRRADALAYWLAPGNTVNIAVSGADVVGTYYLRANQPGGGSHVANCGYVVSSHAQGRGIARAMCLHSIEAARLKGFRAMQFNFVVSTNSRAVELWRSLGFAVVGTLPGAFAHPRLGYVDALVMHRAIEG